MNGETKRCPACGDDKLIRLASLNQKICHTCGHVMVWNLDPGQRPLVGPSREIRPRDCNE